MRKSPVIKRTWLELLFLVFSGLALAQEAKKNELGFVLGAEIIPDAAANSGLPIRFGKSISYSLTYARRLTGESTALFLEFPVSAAPSHSIQTAQPAVITDVATLFITPSLKVRFADRSAFSPWISGGFGYGLYEGSDAFNNAVGNPSVFRHTAAAQFGGGIDIRTPIHILFPIGLRAEVRDYYTLDTPNFGSSVTRSGQHNVVAAGGFTVSF
jgi:hypothetical protein